MLAYSEACERNKQPILGVLTDVFANRSRVLEVGSGTGQHAVYFGRNLSHLQWQPTELAEYLPGLRDRIEAQGPVNVAEPRELDVRSHPWFEAANVQSIDAVFTANTLHIMSWSEVEHFFTGIGDILEHDAVLCIYGPFRYGGEYTSDSNASFDRYLQQRDPLSGIRDFEQVSELARKQGLRCLKDHTMPANNQLLVWAR